MLEPDRFPILEGAEAYRSAGRSGAPALRSEFGIALIHGFTGNPISMRPLAERLVALGFRVDVPRLPGHGTDARDMQRTRYADWRAEALAAVERLARESAKIVLVGLSMGGAIALDLASSKERAVAGVVVINPQILERKGIAVKFAPLFERVLPMAPASLAGLRKDDIAKPGVSERAYDRVPTASGNSFLRELPRIRSQLGALACPLLVAHSPEDHSVPAENSQELLRMVPRAQELLLERSYHVATLDYDLELLEARIAEFCDALTKLTESARTLG